MTTLRVSHRTAYHYDRPMRFGPHSLILRPRESRSLRLNSHRLELVPEAKVTWAQDVAGNSVATATFAEPADTLIVESVAEVSLFAEKWPIFDIAASAATYPFPIGDNEMTDLGALRLQAYLDTTGRLHKWAHAYLDPNGTDTLTLLKNMCAGIAEEIEYEVREDTPAQSPVDTLALGRGSCRDFAVLFVDAVRSLGFGARIVSGYLYDPDLNAIGSSGSGSTHAWAEVYVPGAGWITFDPTNRSVGGFNLIPVAVARHIDQIMPVSGSFVGDPAAFQSLDVNVTVESVERRPKAHDQAQV